MTKKKAICAPMALMEAIDYPEPVPFSRGMRVDLGKMSLLFISGTASVDQKGRTVYIGDFLGQARHTFRNLTMLLESEGADWHDVVRTTCYLKDMKDYEVFNKFRIQFYRDKKLPIFPASTCVEAGLCRPELLVEVEMIAIVANSKKNGKK